MSIVERIVTAHNIRKEYVLPDGKIITLDTERFMCFEPLVSNTLVDGSYGASESMDLMISRAIASCDRDLQDTFYQNIVLGGGNTFFPGLKARLEKLLHAAQPSKKIIIRPPRQHSAWIGGSILSSLSAFQPMWLLKEEYDECGTMTPFSLRTLNSRSSALYRASTCASFLCTIGESPFSVWA